MAEDPTPALEQGPDAERIAASGHGLDSEYLVDYQVCPVCNGETHTSNLIGDVCKWCLVAQLKATES